MKNRWSGSVGNVTTINGALVVCNCGNAPSTGTSYLKIEDSKSNVNVKNAIILMDVN